MLSNCKLGGLYGPGRCEVLVRPSHTPAHSSPSSRTRTRSAVCASLHNILTGLLQLSLLPHRHMSNSNTSFHRLQRVQTAAARIVCQAPRRQHHSVDLLKDLCAAESTTRLPSSVIKPSNCNNLRILLVYSRHTDSRMF